MRAEAGDARRGEGRGERGVRGVLETIITVLVPHLLRSGESVAQQSLQSAYFPRLISSSLLHLLTSRKYRLFVLDALGP